MVRLRRGERSVIVAIGLRRSAAERLAAAITELVEVVPSLVGIEVAVPRLRPAVW
jgi:hypothetical protein